MPWTEVTEMELKEKFIELALQPKCNMSALCQQFTISRKTGYKYLKRYIETQNFESLKPQSRQPNKSPTKTSDLVEGLVLSVRDKNSKWGGDKIRRYLLNIGYKEMPSAKTITRILKRNGRICEDESQKHKPFIRFEHEHPNDLWQMDFKGDFKTGTGRCYPLTLLDDHSRYSLLIKSCSNQQHDTVKEELTKVFCIYGLPNKMTMDNGAPWGYSGRQLHTRLTAWLIRLGIYVTHSRPYHPQTQGKLERFHRTLKDELLSLYSFTDLAHAQEGFDYWRQIYNDVRPHGAIGLEVPSQRYRTSEKAFPVVLPKIEYAQEVIVRKVNRDGVISLRGRKYRVGDSFAGLHVALEETEEANIMSVRFCHQKVYKIDLNNVAA